MRIAVVGSGIAGLGAAWLLSRQHEVVVFEAGDRLGGHTHTHLCRQDGREHAIDTGFIVFNRHNYPLLDRLFNELGVASQPTTMSFAVQDARTGLEYNATRLDTLFCQRRNLVSPRFWGMVRDIVRFYRAAPALLEGNDPGPTLGEYLEHERYSRMFIEDHLVPMASALWSSPSAQVMEFPARQLVRFMDNHRMMQVDGRPEWRVVCGGSSTYVQRITATWSALARLGTPVTGVRREAGHVAVESSAGVEHFDQVVLACHSDQALALLEDPSDAERHVLGAITYQPNETVLHTDVRMLPGNTRAWAAWNVHVPAAAHGECTVSYCMNLLQSIQSREPYIVTLNRTAEIDPSRVIARMRYAHPVHSHASVAARERREEISGRRRTWYAGAYWGFGFHEDGLRSGVEVARALGVSWP